MRKEEELTLVGEREGGGGTEDEWVKRKEVMKEEDKEGRGVKGGG